MYAIRSYYVDEGKPEQVVNRIVEGRLSKYKDEVCLMQQAYIRDDSMTITDLIHQNIASLGENILVRRFVRWEIGEGIE